MWLSAYVTCNLGDLLENPNENDTFLTDDKTETNFLPAVKILVL